MGPSLDAALLFIVLLLPFDQVKESSGCAAITESAARVAILAGTRQPDAMHES